ncbi:TonB-dependent receptor [Xylanibacter muris]|uniref:TonB-dependent receptor n=1 Tax=Xylanibacter muris TaxID=2736290 RepID=A0ABX2ASH3_9BACT|nr:TonB-dependent receptor [Xylanibacter muris]NPD93160.1 TonB-dependent receptor [Xylanibacter muris]
MKTKRHLKKKLFISGILLLPKVAGIAVASESLSITNTSTTLTRKEINSRIDTSRVIDLDEVTVVSQPKEHVRLRRQALSSNVFTDNELQSLQLKDISRLSSLTPSFIVPAYGSRLTSSIYVRGIGSRSGEPAAGVYFDNIPLINKGSYNRHFYQLDRVDLLRGPQGTLYGINSEGGLIRMFSKDPMKHQGTYVSCGIGTGLYSNAEIAQYHRPSDNFAFSAAAFYTGQKGFFNNINTGGNADLSNEAGGRMRFMINNGNRLSMDIMTEYQYTNQNAFAYGEYNNATGHFSNPSTTIMSGYKRQLVTSGLHLSYRAPRFIASSTTSYQYLNDMMQMDQDYMPADYMRLIQMQKSSAVTQEFTIRGNGENKWMPVSGIFLSHQWLRTDGPVYFGDDMNAMIKRSMLGGLTNNPGIPQNVKDMLAGMTITDNNVPGVFHTPQLNIGIYHESNLNLNRRLKATLGIRYDFQRISISYDTRSQFLLNMKMTMPGGNTVPLNRRYTSSLNGSAEKNYSQLLPKFSLLYSTDNSGSNVYVTISKGFRAGGYNLQMFSDIFRTEQGSLGAGLMQMAGGDMNVEHTPEDYSNINNTITYKPEESWNHEIGTHLNILGNKLHADIAIFHTQIRNQQLSVMAGKYGYGRMMINAGRSRSYGMEMSLRGSAADGHIKYGATYSCTNSTFRKYTDGENNYKGKRVPFIPQHTFSLNADYCLNIEGSKLIKSVTAGADVNGNGRTYWDTENNFSQNFYAIAGVHVILDFGKLKANIWGRNITDTRYNTFLINNSADGTSRSFAQQGNPLQIGTDISIKL